MSVCVCVCVCECDVLLCNTSVLCKARLSSYCVVQLYAS